MPALHPLDSGTGGLLVATAATSADASGGLRPVVRGGLALLVLAFALAWARGGVAEATTVTGRTMLLGQTLPALERATRLPDGTAGTSGADPLTLTLTLNRMDQQGFDALLRGIEDPTSSSYQHYLTQEQIADRFGPSQSAYDQVLHWLDGQGFTLTQGSTNRLTLTVAGTRAQAERAFGVTIGDYTLDGKSFYANDQNPRLPSTIAGSVQSVQGFTNLSTPGRSQGNSELIEQAIKFCLDYGGWSVAGCIALVTFLLDGVLKGYAALCLTPLGAMACTEVLIAVVAVAALAGLLTNPTYGPFHAPVQSSHPPSSLRAAAGAVQKLGLLEYDTFRVSDVANWLQLNTGNTSHLGQLTTVHINGGVTTPGVSEAEVLLDVDAAIAGAPGVQVVAYDAPPSTSFQTLFNAMIGDGDTVISNSWSYCEDQTTLADVQSLDSIFANGAASGVSILSGSGDSGSTCLDGSIDTVGVPADAPHGTAVGGTTPLASPGFAYGGERWWDGTNSTPRTGQGGFGTSRFFSRPSYQNGFTASPMRSVPDVVTTADPIGGLSLCQADAGGCPDGKFHGGTSYSAPQLATMVVGLNAAVGRNLGELNPLLYPLASSGGFHTPASMLSDFAHVGIGSPVVNTLALRLTGGTVGTPSATLSVVLPVPRLTPSGQLSATIPADGLTQLFVQVNLVDSNLHTVSGRNVSLSASAGSSASISPPGGPSNAGDGVVFFTVTDSKAEDLTLTATDTTDGIILQYMPVVHVESPPATVGGIGAAPSTATADGVASSTVTVTLHNAQGQGAAGKSVSLAQGGGHSIVTGPTPSLTGADGMAQFTVTDTTPEAVTYTAIDVTDGNLPLPASAMVTFTGPGAACTSNVATAAAGFALSAFATGFYNQHVSSGCDGPIGVAFDGSGNLFALDYLTGIVYKFGPTGGVADGATRINMTALGGSTAGLAFTKDGRLYAAMQSSRTVVELSPSTGAVLRTLVNDICLATGLAVDPLSGDLFVSSDCSDIYRLSNLTGTVSESFYNTTTGACDGLTFAPDGTLYAACVPPSTSTVHIFALSGTNTPFPGTATDLGTVPLADGVAVLVDPAHPTQSSGLLVNGNDGHATRIDLVNPAHPLSDIFTGGSRGDFVVVGPDGCAYATQSDRIVKVTAADGSCPFSPTNPLPQLSLTPTTVTPNPRQGTPVTLMATLRNQPNPSATPITFVVSGANAATGLVYPDSSGKATFTYSGVAVGKDTVIAFANPGGTLVNSNSSSVTWASGNHTTFVSLNQSATAGYPNQPVTVTGNLSDISTQPATTPLAGQTLSFSLSGAGGSCTGTTDATGTASCMFTPTSAPGSYTLTVTFSATGQYLASSDATGFTLAAGSKPVLQTVTPASGAAEGGKPISIAGSNIQPGATVSIGGRLAGNIVVGAGGASVSATTPGYLYWGDVNGDTLATVLDALCLLRAIVGLPETPNCPASGFQVTLPLVVSNPGGGSAVVPGGYTYNTGDLTGNGPLSVLDALCLLRSIVGLSATQNCPAPVPPGVPAPARR